MKWWACKLIYLSIFTIRTNFLKLLQPIQSLKWMKVITTSSEKNPHYTSGKANVPLSGQKLNLTLKMINLPVLRQHFINNFSDERLPNSCETECSLHFTWMSQTLPELRRILLPTVEQFAVNNNRVSSARNLEFAICQRLTLVHLRAVLYQWTEVHWRTIGFFNGNLARQYKSWQTLALVQCCRFYERLAWSVVWPFHYNKSTFAQRAVAIAHL